MMDYSNANGHYRVGTAGVIYIFPEPRAVIGREKVGDYSYASLKFGINLFGERGC